MCSGLKKNLCSFINDLHSSFGSRGGGGTNLIVEMIQLYISSDLRIDLINVCTGLWLISNGNQSLNRSLEKIIVEASLSDDVYRMPILMDIWTLYLRYDMNYFLFLR